MGLEGNYGYWDELLALQWVYNNVGAFGGNPNSIVMFGESSGAVSTTLHLMNTSNTLIKGT